MEFQTMSDAIKKGADFQLYEWQLHNQINEEWILREAARINEKKGRIAIPVKQTSFITLFVDDLAGKSRKAMYKSLTNFSHREQG